MIRRNPYGYSVCGAPEGTRIPDLSLRRRPLYPAELRAPIQFRKNAFVLDLRIIT